MDKVSLLQSASIFAEMPSEALSALVDLLYEVECKAGDTVVTEGEWGTTMYIVVEGQMYVHSGGRTLARLEAGAVFGEMAALHPEPRNASVTAMSDARLLGLDQEALLALINERPLVAHGIVRKLCRDLRASNRNMVEDYQYIQQVMQITQAAANVERGVYNPEELDKVTQRTDELGQLARVFQKMIAEVHLREQQLRLEVQQLRIEVDEAKRQQQVQEITETDFFHDLQAKARQLRGSQNSSETSLPA
jgi:CRP-like cAMP-binding protein